MVWPEDFGWPQDIGAIGVFDHAPGAGRDSGLAITEIREAIGRRLDPLPRFRRQLCMPRPGLGWPVWVDAASFDVARHVEAVPVAPPGDDASLLATAEALFERRLDRRLPLWRISFLPGLEGGRVGVVVKLHHALADGVAGVAALGALLDATPDAAPPPPTPWIPQPPPSPHELLVDNLRRRWMRLVLTMSALAHPVAGARAARRAYPAVREALASGK